MSGGGEISHLIQIAGNELVVESDSLQYVLDKIGNFLKYTRIYSKGVSHNGKFHSSV